MRIRARRDSRGHFPAHGCRTVLRATYTDPSGSLTVTVGIVVLPSTAAAQSAVSDLTIQPPHAGYGQ